MGAYSQDLRERILKGLSEGGSTEEVAKRYGVHRSTAWRFWRRYEQEGERTARQAGGRRPIKLAGHEEWLRRWTQKKGDITLAELQAKCREELGLRLSQTTIWNRLGKLGLSHKKKSAGGGAGPERR